MKRGHHSDVEKNTVQTQTSISYETFKQYCHGKI